MTLHGYVHPLANAANDRGAAPDSMPLSRMHLVLKRSDTQESALKQYLADLHKPGSASYHQWLTPGSVRPAVWPVRPGPRHRRVLAFLAGL